MGLLTSQKNIIILPGFFFLQIGTWICANGQSTRFPSDRDNKIILELNYEPEKKINLPVKEIEILDARFNQSYIGISTGTSMIGSEGFRRQDIVFPVKFDVYLRDKLNDWFALNLSSGDKLIILVKKFRTIDNIRKMLISSKRKEVFFLFSASFFLQRDQTCFRLGGVDKWYSSDHFTNTQYLVKKDYNDWLITNVLVHELRQIRFVVNENTVSFSRNEVDIGIKQRFDLPVMGQKIKKGIYRTYQDFLLNQPSDTSYKVATLKSRKIVFVDSGGRLLTSSNAWAISDGKMTVFMLGSSFYEIEVRNNTLRVRTFRKADPKKSVLIVNDLHSMGLVSKKVRRAFAYSDMPDYLDIDMETGELFLEELIGPYKLSTLTEAIREN